LKLLNYYEVDFGLTHRAELHIIRARKRKFLPPHLTDAKRVGHSCEDKIFLGMTIMNDGDNMAGCPFLETKPNPLKG